MLAIDPRGQVPAQLVGEVASLLVSDVLRRSCHHRPQVPQIHLVADATSRLGSILPVGSTQVREQALHGREARLGHRTRARHLPAGGALTLLLGGLADRADSLVRKPFRNRPLFRRQRGQPGVTVLAVRSQARCPLWPVPPFASMARPRALRTPVLTTAAPAAPSFTAWTATIATSPAPTVSAVVPVAGESGGTRHPFCEALRAEVLDTGGHGLVRLGGQHLAHRNAVDAHLGLNPENVTHSSPGRQQLGLQQPLRLARSGSAPCPGAIGAAARQQDVEAVRHALKPS